MKLLDWLLARTTDYPIEELPPEPPRLTTTVPSSSTVADLRSSVAVETDEVVFTIDYEAASGEVTRRTVTLLSINPLGRDTLLRAACHLRGTIRTFRADRILCVIDSDGEVFVPEDYFRSRLAIELFGSDTPLEQDRSFDLAASQAKALRDKLRPELTILVLAAHIDGKLHENEVDAIETYLEQEASKIGIAVSLDTAQSLSTVVRRMRPTAQKLDSHIQRIAESDPARQDRFWNTLKRVMAADGIAHINELKMIEELAASQRRLGYI